MLLRECVSGDYLLLVYLLLGWHDNYVEYRRVHKPPVDSYKYGGT